MVVGELEALRQENARLKMLIEQFELPLDQARNPSEVEIICLSQIQLLERALRDRGVDDPITKTEAEVLDMLHKNLRLAQNRSEEGKIKINKKKDKSTEDLLNFLSKKA